MKSHYSPKFANAAWADEDPAKAFVRYERDGLDATDTTLRAARY